MPPSVHPPLELSFRFFDLPAELRAEIYNYVLQNDTFSVKYGPSRFSRHRLRSHLCRPGTAGGFFLPHPLALIDINQQARLELAPLVFSSKVQIRLQSHTGLLNLTRNFGALALERITFLRMNMYLPEFAGGMTKKPSLRELFCKFTGLKLLELRVYLAAYDADPVDGVEDCEFTRALGVRELRAAWVEVDLKCVVRG
ncbi:hypothetical protein BU16DRAFT_615283 [Lophium mytilinum]|uniref:F-box domain-containing protein n=1 Tax=Lophium mytilinum TaxID=390894 RepID=A0A6A6R1E6_9PEZI|nr:hypothetical protein BU16DRAFT_615283 [Lophium mytilinum]